MEPVMEAQASPPRIAGLADLAAKYDSMLCDIWGVLHNGVAAFESAVEALTKARAAGIKVVLISNAPRPSAPVIEQLARLGVPPSAYDAIITSGDVTRELLSSRYAGARLTHIGPHKDRPLVEGLPVTFTSDEEAEVCLCSGLLDDTSEVPEDYRNRLEGLAARHVPMICANPDKVVEMGGRLIYCAGALADLYEELGGQTIIMGKPFAPIYEAARTLAGDLPASRLLALGDSMRTDLRGAHEQAMDCLFLTGGLHAEEFGPSLNPSEQRVAQFLASAPYPAVGWMARLKW